MADLKIRLHIMSGKFWVNNHAHIIKAKDEMAANHFILYALNFLDLNPYIVGSTRKKLNQEKMKQILIPLPSLVEQRVVASILSFFDDYLSLLDQYIAKLERLKKGLMNKLVTEGVNIFVLELDKLLSAVSEIIDNGDYLFGREENLNHHLAKYLELEFRKYQVDVDIEVSKDNMQRPDIIIHRRGTNYNLFVIEVKKNCTDISNVEADIEKLEKLMLEKYNYAEAVFIGFNVADSQIKNIMNLSDKISYIIVTEDKQLRTKTPKRELKQTPRGKIPKDWNMTRLIDIANIIMGQSPPSSTYNKQGNGLPFLQGKMEFGSIFPTPTIFCSSPIKIAEVDDVLISVRAPVGDVNLANHKLCIGRGLAAIRFKDNVAHNWFYFYYFQKCKNFLESLARGSTFKAITEDDLENLEVPVPSLAEQHTIANILSSADEKIELVRKYKDTVNRIKRFLLDVLLSGRVRIKYV